MTATLPEIQEVGGTGGRTLTYEEVGMQGTVVGGKMVDELVVGMQGGSVVEVVELVGPTPVVLVDGARVLVVGGKVDVVVLTTVVVVVPGGGAPGQPNDCSSAAKSPDTPGKPAKAPWSDSTRWQMGSLTWSSWATATPPPIVGEAATAG